MAILVWPIAQAIRKVGCSQCPTLSVRSKSAVMALMGRLETRPWNQHLRQIPLLLVEIDNVFMVQSLVSLKDSVHLWLPSGTDGDWTLSLQSSEQLEEFIKCAEEMPALKTKTQPPVMAKMCGHTGNRLNKGGNQHGKWVV